MTRLERGEGGLRVRVVPVGAIAACLSFSVIGLALLPLTLAGLAFVAAGILFAGFIGEVTTITTDRAARMLTVAHRSLFIRDETRVRFGEVLDVDVAVSATRSRRGTTRTAKHVRIVLRGERAVAAGDDLSVQPLLREELGL